MFKLKYYQTKKKKFLMIYQPKYISKIKFNFFKKSRQKLKKFDDFKTFSQN